MTEPVRRASSSTSPGLADCPKCDGKKVIPLGVVPNVRPCDFCLGHDGQPTGKVPLTKANDFFGLEPITRRDTPAALEAAKADESRDTEPAPPPVPRPDPRRDPDD